ncbi:MAG: domain containing protein [Bryobacterales bacterium]|nr:domain containing protein [Bryobacterales bacterium]
MKWYYAESGRQVGPVEESVLDELVRQGVVRDDTLVWRDGMAAWQRHSAVRGGSSPSSGQASAPPPPPQAPSPVGDSRYCSECGRPFAAHQLTSYGDVSVCAQCQPAYSQRLGAGTTRHYGGFWIRFLALIIDSIIVNVVGAVIRIPLGVAMGGLGLGLGRNPDPSQVFAALPAILSLAGLSFLIQTALSLGYEVYFLSTRGATPGKMALSLKVIRADGSPVSPGLAAGRYFARILSAMTLMIGFIIAAFDREKRALHDHICGTRVIHTR